MRVDATVIRIVPRLYAIDLTAPERREASARISVPS